MGEKKNFALNLAAQIIVFLCNCIISVFLTPFVLDKLGTEAYGFIGLVNNLVSYISIVTVALNSLAGRYITLSYHQGNIKEAKEYMSSVFFANVLLAIIVFVCSFFITFNVSRIFKVPSELTVDVMITMFLAFANTCLSLLSVVFSVAAFIKNKLFFNSIINVISSIIRVVVIVGCFLLFVPHMWYYTIAGVICTIVVLVFQYLVTKHLTPELKVSVALFDRKKILEIIKSGVWISLESLNKILQTGLDLIISNLFVSAAATGILSVAKSLPNVLLAIPAMIAAIFAPKLAKLYAEKRTTELVENFKFSIRFLNFLVAVPLAGFIVFGKDFYQLWLSTRAPEEIDKIYILSGLTVLPLLINAYVEGLYYANTLTNRIKGSVIITFGFSLGSVVTEFILLYFTDIDPLYVIAGTSACFMSVRNFFVTPIYCAYVLGLPKLTFFKDLVKALLSFAIMFVGFAIVNHYVRTTGWFSFALVCLACGLVAYIFQFFISFNREEKKEVASLLKRRLHIGN